MKTLNDQFVEWLYETQAPVWDDRLVDLMEDGDIQLAFLDYMGLPDDTDIDTAPAVVVDFALDGIAA